MIWYLLPLIGNNIIQVNQPANQFWPIRLERGERERGELWVAMTRTLLSSPAIDAGAGAMSVSWWDEINESVLWQDGIFYSLCAAYALVSAVALVSLLRWCFCISFLLSLCLLFLNSSCDFALPNLWLLENGRLLNWKIGACWNQVRCLVWIAILLLWRVRMCVGSFLLLLNSCFVFLPNIGEYELGIFGDDLSWASCVEIDVVYCYFKW